MGTLGTLSAIVPAASQKERDHGMGSLQNVFETRHHSNEYIFAFGFCTSIYIEICMAQRSYVCLHCVSNFFV